MVKVRLVEGAVLKTVGCNKPHGFDSYLNRFCSGVPEW